MSGAKTFRLLAALILLTTIGSAQSTPSANDEAARAEARKQAEASLLYQTAVSELEALASKEGLEARQEILTRNLSRYFVVYLVPPETEELARILGTTQRMTQQAGRTVYRLAQSVASEAGSPRIEAEHVQAVKERLLPRRRGELDDWIYFPAALPTPIEDWDLEAFLGTGLAWEVLGYLADAMVGPDANALPITEAATSELIDALNAYGLLALRLGGEHAEAEMAPHLKTQHLRLAGKTIAARASGDPAAILEPPPVAPAGSHFLDVTEAAGLDFLHRSSEWLSRFRRFGPIAPTFSGGGVAAGDIDGDRWDDLVFCGGRGCVLYRNRGDGTFEDWTQKSSVGVDGEARMPLLADFDNDGDQDLFVTYARDTNRLFLNRGDGRFDDRTAASGLEQQGDISGPATAVDVDGDGLLDLYVGNFGNYLEGESAWVAQDSRNGMANRLYRNLGTDGGIPRFEDTTERAGVGDQGWAQALSHLDYDGDGDQDLYIANDFGRNELFENRGDGTFEPAGERTFADDRFHGMNVSYADLNNDRLADIFITNIWFWASARKELTETNTLLLSNRDEQGRVSYSRSDHPVFREHDSGWAWAGLFFDVENDGDDDLFVANGFTDYMTFVQYREHPEIEDQLYPIHNARDPNLFLVNERGPGSSPGAASIPDQRVATSGAELRGFNSRSAALLDFDHDGDLDLAVTTFHDRARLFENVAGDRGAQHWLTLELVGDPKNGSPRDAIGAHVIATDSSSQLQVWRLVTGGEGYLGQSSRTLELGVGGSTAVDLEIRWPSGRVETLRDVPTHQAIVVVEGATETPRFRQLWRGER